MLCLHRLSYPMKCRGIIKMFKTSLNVRNKSSSATFDAIVLNEFLPSPPFRADQLPVRSLPCLVPSKGLVVLNVRAAAVNFPDVLMVQGKYQVKPDLPFSPGFEVAGTVLAIGEGAKVREGDRVIGFYTHGGFAQQMLVPSKTLVPIPEGMGFEEASALLMAYGTSYHALEKAALKAGQRILVLGASGGVGLAAIQISKILGAHVIAAASSDEKLRICKVGYNQFSAHGALVSRDSYHLFRSKAPTKSSTTPRGT
jgi:NADPH:quinone reductase-like Zn-dependent oxidoreductase